MALAAGVMDRIIGKAGWNTCRIPLGAGMAISTVRGQGYPKGMIGAAMFCGKAAVAGIARAAASMPQG